MILTIDWTTKIITVPKAQLTHVSGTLYKLDTIAFKLAIRDLEASVDGIAYPNILSYNAPYTVSGITYYAKVEIINGYRVQFENGLYSVLLEGSNNNIFDVSSNVLVQNTVQVIPNNSAGGQVVTIATGSGVQPSDITDIANAVWNKPLVDLITTGSIGEFVKSKLLTVGKFLSLK